MESSLNIILCSIWEVDSKVVNQKMVEKKHSNHNNWETPTWLYEKLDKQFSFDYDPCPLNESPDFNGLNEEWGKSTFVNPPYGREIGLWVKKAYDEWRKGKTIVMLMPVRTDTNYFHNYILGKAKLIFIKGRLRFRGYWKKQKKIVDNEPASFPTMLVIYLSPTSQTSPKGDFSNEKEHNISLKESSSEDSQMSNDTSPNPNIKTLPVEVQER